MSDDSLEIGLHAVEALGCLSFIECHEYLFVVVITCNLIECFLDLIFHLILSFKVS